MNRWNSESDHARMNSRVVTEEDKVTHDYDDIINLPHYEPKHHPRMSMMARAAQFAPFAAVAGHDAAIREERLRVGDGTSEIGRVTDE